MSIYRQLIIDNYKNPMNKGELDNPDLSAENSNPLCGDKIKIEIKLNKNKIVDIKFSGVGCAISQASASMLTEEVKGKSIKEIIELKKEIVNELLGIELSAARIECGLLPLKVLKLATLKSYKQQ